MAVSHHRALLCPDFPLMSQGHQRPWNHPLLRHTGGIIPDMARAREPKIRRFGTLFLFGGVFVEKADFRGTIDSRLGHAHAAIDSQGHQAGFHIPGLRGVRLGDRA